MQAEKLKAIVAGEIKGEEAIEILRQERMAAAEAQKAMWERSSLIAHAEGVLLYGPAGRPHGGGTFNP